MPVVPTFQSKEKLPSSLGLVNPTPEDMGAGIGNAISEAGLIFQRVNEARQLNNLTTQLHKETSEFIFNLENNPDSFETWEQDTAEFLKQKGEQLQGTARTRAVGDSFSREFNRVSLLTQADVRAKARKRLVDVGVGDLAQNLLEMQKVYASQSSDITRGSTLSDVDLLLENAQNSGLIGDEDLVVMRENFRQDAFSTRVRNEMSLDPVGTLEKLKNNEFGLSPENNGIWKERAESAVSVAINSQVRLEEKREAKEAKRTKEAQNDLENNYLSQIVELQSNELEVPMAITQKINSDIRAGKLRASQGRSLLSDIQNENLPSDDGVFNGFDEDIEDQRAVVDNNDIRTAAGLSSKDKAKLIKKNNTFQDKRFSNDFKQGKERLKAAIRTQIGQFSPFAKEDEADKFSLVAVPELEERLMDKEPLKEILSDMLPRFTSAPTTLTSLPKPRFSATPVSSQDVIKKLADMKLSVMEKGITTSNYKEFNREIELLESYLDAFKSMERKQ